MSGENIAALSLVPKCSHCEASVKDAFIPPTYSNGSYKST